MKTSHLHTEAHETSSRTTLGFWIYLMSDCLLFASLFATYAVLHGNTFGGPSAKDLFSIPFVLLETLILLTSSFSAGLGLLAAHRGHTKQVLAWFTLTLVLGLTFLALELSEFIHLWQEGADWMQSGFLSAFFTLVGTHGLHVAIGSIWMTVLIAQVAYDGITEMTWRRLMCISLFWHFLDVIWILIFSLVYLIPLI